MHFHVGYDLIVCVLERGISTEGLDFGGTLDDLVGDIGLLEDHAKD